MNKKIILHIGLYKTGSTFIQEHLGKVENDNFQIFLPRGKLVEHLLDYLDNPREITRNKILAIINECKSNVIISSEGIFGHQSNGFINVLKRMRLLESLPDRIILESFPTIFNVWILPLFFFQSNFVVREFIDNSL